MIKVIIQIVLLLLLLNYFLVQFTNFFKQYSPEIADLDKEQESLIMFYSPEYFSQNYQFFQRCFHCQQALPLFIEAGFTAYKIYNMRFATINLKLHPEIKKNYQIFTFPTFKYLYHGNLLEYDGDYNNADDFERWIINKKNQIQIIKETQFLSNQILFIGELQSNEFYTYRSALFDQKEIFIKQQKDEKQIIFFKDNKSKIMFNEEFTIDNIQQFIKKNEINPILTYSDIIAKQIVEGQKTTLFLLNQTLQQDFINLQNKVGGFITLCLAYQNQDSDSFYNQFNFTDIPTLVLLEFQKNRILEYHQNIASAIQMEEFVDKFLQKNLIPLLKSGPPILVNQSEYSIQEIISKNFYEKVHNNELDVLVYFYNKDCGFCQKFDPVYQKIALQYHKKNKILFYKIDSIQNQVLEHDIDSTPSIFLYKKGSKNYIEWNHPRNENNFKKFIQEHTQNTQN